MSYFDISLDTDIDYLIKEVGKDIKINNIDSKAIINNVGNETDDKRIITKSELKRGDYINYNILYFLVLDEINDKRYNTYNKAIIRRCNFDIKFVIGDRLYLYYAIVEGDKFYIQNDSIISMSADTITVTLPKTDVTKQIKEQDCFIKFNKKWEIQGINYTKSGLIILNCQATAIDATLDDLENEIANKDKLADTTIIYPFTDIEPQEPQEPEPTQNYTIELENNYESLVFGLPVEFTATVYQNGQQVDKQVKFEIIRNPHLAWIEVDEKNPNECYIYGNKENNSGDVTLRVSLVDDESIYIEREYTVGSW